MTFCKILLRRGALAAVVCAIVAQGCAGMMYRPGREFRTINTARYEVSIQKNGRIDVLTPSGEAIFDDVFPMVWLADEDGPEPLDIDGRWSERKRVSDRLGAGHGMALRKGDCEWSIRTYTTQPFLVAQVAYVNTGREPVRVKALLPWCVGEPYQGSVGRIEGRVTGGMEPAIAPWRPEGWWDDYVQIVTPEPDWVVTAGFLTHDRGLTHLRAANSSEAREEDTGYGLFRAQCSYEPAIEVAPGERLLSEVVFVSFAQEDERAALRRYGHAAAAVNEVPRTLPFMPHGWWPSPGDQTRLTSEVMTREMDALANGLATKGYAHVQLPMDVDSGDEPRLVEMVPTAHRLGLTAGCSWNPFVVPAGSACISEQPDWYVESAQAQAGQLVLDVTAPGVVGYLRQEARLLTETQGWDLLNIGDGYLSLMDSAPYRDARLTGVERVHLALAAIREGMSRDCLLAASGPAPIVGKYAQILQPREDDSGQTVGLVPGSVQNGLHYMPYLGVPGVAVAKGNPEAHAAGAALVGGVVGFQEAPSELDRERALQLARLLPVAPYPAWPLPGSEGKAWASQFGAGQKRWALLGLCNDSDAGEWLHRVSLQDLGLADTRYATVFELTGAGYEGTGRDGLAIAVQPGQCRLFAFRPYSSRPMIVGSTSHFSMGAMECDALTWNAAGRTLRGTAAPSSRLAILSPIPYQPARVDLGGRPLAALPTLEVNRVFYLEVPAATKPVPWQVVFEEEPGIPAPIE